MNNIPTFNDSDIYKFFLTIFRMMASHSKNYFIDYLVGKELEESLEIIYCLRRINKLKKTNFLVDLF